MKIAAFASGNGSNLSALIEHGIEIEIIICNKPDAFVIERAKKYGIKCYIIPTKNRKSADYEMEMLKLLQTFKIDLIVLAGYMRIVGDILLDQYEGRIVNIHPSLLPSFKGEHAISDAYNYGVKVSGVTVHLIDSEMDEGTILMQEIVTIEECDSLQTFEEKIHQVEYNLYYKAINKIIKERNEKSVSKCK